MNSRTRKRDRLEDFFDAAGTPDETAPGKDAGDRRGYTVVEDYPRDSRAYTAATHGDLFDKIETTLEKAAAAPVTEKAASPKATPPAPQRRTRPHRRRWLEESDRDDAGDENLPFEKLFVAGKFVVTHIVTFVVVIGISALLILGARGVYNVWSEHSARQAQAEQTRHLKWDAFMKAGWRQSETEHHDSPAETFSDEEDYNETAYLKELGPDYGRVHLRVIDHGDRKSYQVSGWVWSAAERAQVIDEINSVFPEAKANIDQIPLRPGGGSLQPGESRIVNPEIRFGSDGKLIDHLQYGESGYAPLVEKGGWGFSSDPGADRAGNLAGGDLPAPPASYFYVISGGGSYWRTPAQRAKLIETAFARLHRGPDSGRGARAVVLVYYDGIQPQLEIVHPDEASPRINSFTSKPATIEQGQSSTLEWSTSDSTGVTIDESSDAPAGNSREAPRATTTYRLTATDPAGSSARQSVTVTVEPRAAGQKSP